MIAKLSLSSLGKWNCLEEYWEKKKKNEKEKNRPERPNTLSTTLMHASPTKSVREATLMKQPSPVLATRSLTVSADSLALSREEVGILKPPAHIHTLRQLGKTTIPILSIASFFHLQATLSYSRHLLVPLLGLRQLALRGPVLGSR